MSCELIFVARVAILVIYNFITTAIISAAQKKNLVDSSAMETVTKVLTKSPILSDLLSPGK